MMLAELPELRKDEAMMRAYMFLMDFLEVVSKETAARLKANQLELKGLMEAAKSSEEKFNQYIADNTDKVLEFCYYILVVYINIWMECSS